MISYIVASHKPDVLNNNLKKTLRLFDGDELIVENESSIARAYNAGIKKAKNVIKCFIHHDVLVVNSEKLRLSLIEHCRESVGIVGVIGTTNRTIVPWWEKDQCGNVIDTRMGLIYFNEGGIACALLDGLILATRQNIEFDERYPGFHLYDHDICQQMLSKGLRNFCLKDGFYLVVHNTSGPANTNALTDWQDNFNKYIEKWSKQ